MCVRIVRLVRALGSPEKRQLDPEGCVAGVEISETELEAEVALWVLHTQCDA